MVWAKKVILFVCLQPTSNIDGDEKIHVWYHPGKRKVTSSLQLVTLPTITSHHMKITVHQLHTYEASSSRIQP
jgi:hypothetical protein